MNNTQRNTAVILTVALLSACTSTEEKVNDLLKRHLDAFVFVEGGSFMMGNPGGWSIRRDTLPAHKVTLDSFSIQKYEVTQGDMDLFMEATGYRSSDEYYDRLRAENANRFAKELPAAASWEDARAFCQWLGSLSDQQIDLPTEAQWEFAARSRGQMYRYSTNTGEAKAGVNMAKNPEMGPYDEKALPLPPGSFPPNPLGLFDMSGNVFEWVLDHYQPDYYKYSPEYNPLGPDTPLIFGSQTQQPLHQKVVRGGSYSEFQGNTTVTRRNGSRLFVGKETGFRCLKSEVKTSL